MILLGTAGYMWIEGWSALDAVYMTVITLTTLGIREVHPLSPAGMIFTMTLSLGGVYTIFFAATAVIHSIVHGDLADYFGSRQMEKSLRELNDHYIVCGFGRMGRLVCHQLAAAGVSFVAVERQAELFEGVQLAGGLLLQGDATSDEVLERAGANRAHGLIAVVGSDADNLYITMSARLLNERMLIVARAEDERSEQKLVRAGATRVVSPYLIGGQRVVQAVLRPHVLDFLELATRREHLELNIEEVHIAPGSHLASKTIESSAMDPQGLIVVAIKQDDGRMEFNPPRSTSLKAGQVLIVLGRREALGHIAELATH
jgi:voltage-gated potassium channel